MSPATRLRHAGLPSPSSLLASTDSDFITGLTINVDDGRFLR